MVSFVDFELAAGHTVMPHDLQSRVLDTGKGAPSVDIGACGGLTNTVVYFDFCRSFSDLPSSLRPSMPISFFVDFS
jgi:hypothetical protein